MSESIKADVIINKLKEQANTILSAALGTTPLEAFNVGSKGNMPYYWQNPRNLQFNTKTYEWISSSLKADTTPIQLDGSFTNLYIQALSKISYSFSTGAQEHLSDVKGHATDLQGEVLRAWQENLGSLPSGDGQPIDLIAAEIASKWADPPTILQKIRDATNLNEVLNNVPASGAPVVPVFVEWLNAIGEVVPLLNNSTMGNAYVRRALAGAQSPTKDNGGLPLDNDKIVPKYEVSTQLSDIINGLKNESQAVKLSMTVTRATEDEFQVSVEGGANFSIPVLDLLTVEVGGKASYFHSDLATTDNETTVQMTFSGVTLVNFGPKDFEMPTQQNWFWKEPIREAIKNGDSDVSGFKFSPDPQIDFSNSGPFGYLMGVAISNYPSMVITVKSSSYEKIKTTFEQEASVGVSFLGIPLGIDVSESTYSRHVTTDEADKTVTITLNPPKKLLAGEAVDSVGWVLGVQPNYPAA